MDEKNPAVESESALHVFKDFFVIDTYENEKYKTKCSHIKSNTSKKYSWKAEDKHNQTVEKNCSNEDENKQKYVSQEKIINPNTIGTRRDPEKTKRDIEKDKFNKTTEDIVKKLESGLIPPGMETDVTERFNSPPKSLRAPSNNSLDVPKTDRFERDKWNSRNYAKGLGNRRMFPGNRSRSPMSNRFPRSGLGVYASYSISPPPPHPRPRSRGSPSKYIYRANPGTSPPPFHSFRKSLSPLRPRRRVISSPRRYHPQRVQSRSPRRRSKSPAFLVRRQREKSPIVTSQVPHKLSRQRSRERFLMELVKISGINQDPPEPVLPAMNEFSIDPAQPSLFSLPPPVPMMPLNMEPPQELMMPPPLEMAPIPMNYFPNPPDMHFTGPPPFPHPPYSHPCGLEIMHMPNNPENNINNGIHIPVNSNVVKKKTNFVPKALKENIILHCRDAVQKLDSIHFPNRVFAPPDRHQTLDSSCPSKVSPLLRCPRPVYDFTSKPKDINSIILPSLISSIQLDEVFAGLQVPNIRKEVKTRDVSAQTDEIFSCMSCELNGLKVKIPKSTMTFHHPLVSVHTQVTNEDLSSSNFVFTPNQSGAVSQEKPVSLMHMTPAQILVAELAARAKTLQRSTVEAMHNARREQEADKAHDSDYIPQRDDSFRSKDYGDNYNQFSSNNVKWDNSEEQQHSRRQERWSSKGKRQWSPHGRDSPYENRSSHGRRQWSPPGRGPSQSASGSSHRNSESSNRHASQLKREYETFLENFQNFKPTNRNSKKNVHNDYDDRR